jgi:hypothetical protein
MMKNDRDAETPLEVLTDIREEMESRGYFHMTNGTDIAALLDELYKLRPLRYAEQEYKHGVLYVWDAVHQTFFEVGRRRSASARSLCWTRQPLKGLT